MKKRTLFKTFLIDATAALLAVCVTVVPAFGDSIDVKPLIAKMPAQTEAEGRVVFEAILKGGRPAILAACECLTPPSQGGDAKVQYLLGGLAFHVARTGAETERQLYSEAIMEAIQKAKDRDVQAFLLGLLRWCGGRECLVPLTAMLADDYLVDPATRVLVAIHAPGTDAVLLKALADSEGARALTLVKAVGELRVEGAIPLIAKFATSGDTDTRRTALQALADIVPVDKSRRTGPGAPAEVLKKACQSTDVLEKSLVTAMYVRHAARLAESGSAAQGAAICREVMAFASEPGVSHLVPPAFETLARIEGAKCVADLITFVNSPDRKMSVAAMKTLISMKNSKSGAELNRILTKGPADLRIALMSALKDTDQEAHADAIVGNLKSDNQDVRNAAIQVLASRRKVSTLIEHLQTCNDGDIPELRKAFLTVVEQKDQKKLSTVLGHASAPARVLALEILGMRRATACYGVIAEASRDTNSLVRLAAMAAMGPTASAENLPTLIRLYQSVTDSSEQAAVLRSAVQASKMVSEPERRADLFLGALLSAPPERKEAIISILPEVGGEKVLQVVVATSKTTGDPLQNSAIRALASWPDAVAIKAILEIAKSSSVLNQQVLLLRGFVRLVQADSQSPETKLGLYREALTLAKRPEEKRLILGTLVEIKTLSALQILANYLDDSDVREEVARLGALIACAEGASKGVTDAAAVPILVKMAEISKDQYVQKRVKTQISLITGSRK